MAAPVAAQTYHVTHTYTLGGDGGWDYLALDTAGHRLFVARQDRIMVVDPAAGALLREIPGLNRAHGVAFAYAAGHGFATSGADSTVTMFDLKTPGGAREDGRRGGRRRHPLRPGHQPHLHDERRRRLRHGH